MSLDTVTSSPQTVWRKIEHEVRQLKDGFGRPIDANILSTVIALRLTGFQTTMSCSGHSSRNTGGPYVVCVSPKAKQYEVRRRAIGNTADPQAKRYEQRALIAVAKERQKLYKLLEDFYTSRSASYQQHLIVTSAGLSGFRLSCQGADQACVLDSETKKRLLMANQREMQAFAVYVKSNHCQPDKKQPHDYSVCS